MSLLLPERHFVRLSVLDFWGNREDNDVPISAPAQGGGGWGGVGERPPVRTLRCRADKGMCRRAHMQRCTRIATSSVQQWQQESVLCGTWAARSSAPCM